MHLGFLDVVVIIIYAMLVLAVAHLFQRGELRGDDDGEGATATRALPWWAIGASLIAANISAEQIIGMSGSAYAVGIAIAGYEWLAAAAMVVIGKYFLPVFLKNQISTMPQFLRLRYGPKTQVTMAMLWIALYTFVSLTAVMWLGATAVHVVTGLNMTVSVILLGLVAGNYALYVGLKSTHFTDVVQVGMLVLGGVAILVFALGEIGARVGASGGLHTLVIGFHTMVAKMPEHFDMVLEPSNPYYKYLPGLATVAGAMWVIQFSYWGFNQYIVQRALAARSIREVQKGMVFAAYLKLLMPAIVVLPGIAAAFLLGSHVAPSDTAYPRLMLMLPSGWLGFVFVALVAAIIASTGSSLSSIAKIFTNDVFQVVYPGATRRLLVIVGKFTAIGALIVAMAVAYPLLGHTDQAFQYIQEYTGFFTPGVIVVFMLGMFWRRTTETGALLAAGGTVIVSAYFAVFQPQIPFIIRMGYVFVICIALAVAGSLLTRPKQETAIDLDGIDYSTSAGYNLASVLIVAILAGLYWYLW